MSALDIRIDSLHWKNIRSFDSLDAPNKNGNQYINFPSKKTLFFQMPNGTGKTTTLHLIRNILSGQLPSDFSEWRRSIGGENEESFLNTPSEFELRLTINGEPYGFKLHLNHNTNEAKFSTSTPQGIRQNWAPPIAFQKAFQNRPDLVQLFVFDAETARHITKRTDEKLLQQAIRQFGGFSSVYDLVGEKSAHGSFTGGRYGTLKEFIKKELGKLSDTGGGKVKGWANARIEVEASRKILSKRATTAKADIKKIQTAKEEIETRIAEIDENYAGLSDQATNLKNSIDVNSRLKTESSMKLLQLLLQPIHNFIPDWNHVKSFHRRHSDWNLPADIGRGWISRLTEEKLCICGRIMDDEHRIHIESNIDEYLDEGKNNEVSSMQGEFQSIGKSNGNEVLLAAEELQQVSEKLQAAQELWETKFDSENSKEIAAERKSLNEKLAQLIIDLEAVEYIYRCLTTTNYEWLRGEGRTEGLIKDGLPTTSVSEIKRVNNLKILEDIEENLISLINKSEGNSSLWEAFQLTQEIIGESLETLSVELRETLSLKATKSWRSMPAAGADKGLRLEIQSDGMKFFRGNNTKPVGVSGAQSVSACYSVASAISSLGDINIPLICDTPFAGFDEGMVPKWYDSISSTFPQVIVLLNTLEKRALVEGAWKNRAENEYHCTIHQTGEASDGGRKFQLSEDMDLFLNLRSAGDEKEDL
jgi:DNA sulfur modification protein DndD